MKTVRRMLYRDIVASVVFVALAFLALSFFIDFVDELQKIGRPGFGLLMAIRVGLKAPLIALLGGNAAVAGGVRYLLVVLFAGCVWPLTFWWFGRLGRR